MDSSLPRWVKFKSSGHNRLTPRPDSWVSQFCRRRCDREVRLGCPGAVLRRLGPGPAGCRVGWTFQSSLYLVFTLLALSRKKVFRGPCCFAPQCEEFVSMYCIMFSFLRGSGENERILTTVIGQICQIVRGLFEMWLKERSIFLILVFGPK